MHSVGPSNPAERGVHTLKHPPLQGLPQRGVLQAIHHRAFDLGQLQRDAALTALRQVLAPHVFAKIEPGVPMETVRRMLGKPMKMTPYELKNVWHYDWRYMDGPNGSDAKIFAVVFNSDLRVLSTGSVADPALSPN